MKTRLDLRTARLRLPGSWPSALVLAVALAVEVVGRQATNDLLDGVALVLLVVALIGARLAMGPSAWAFAHPAFAAARRAVAQVLVLRFEIGLDLRQTPQLLRRCPPALELVLGFLASIATLVVGLALLPPIPYRDVATSVLYLGHLAILGILWTGLLCAIAASILLPAACFHHLLRSRVRPRSREQQVLVLGLWFGLVLAAGSLLPPWCALLLLALGFGLLALTLSCRRGSEVVLTWRLVSGGEVHAIPWQSYQLRCAGAAVLALAILVVLSLGSAALGLSPLERASLPVTTTLGQIAAWLGGTAVLLGAVVLRRWIHQQRCHDPARPCPTSVHLSGKRADLPFAAARLERLGWSTRSAPAAVQPPDVRIELTDAMPALRGTPRWPLPVSLRALDLPELQHLLRRRDDIQRRRTLLRGFDKLLKAAATRAPGRGLWIAPHYWYVAGMVREAENDAEVTVASFAGRPVGPPFHTVFPRAARNHLHVVLRAIEVDVIFLESGVGHRRFRHVLHALLEHYDVHGARRIEDRNLTGLPGTRAVIHDHEIGEPRPRSRYPEPSYEPLARARILHVLRDRGEYEARVEDPVGTRGAPVPLGV